MELFSQRYGYVQPKMLQVEDMDMDLRNRLLTRMKWFVKKIFSEQNVWTDEYSLNSDFRFFMYDSFLKENGDNFPYSLNSFFDFIKDFILRKPHNRVYDLFGAIVFFAEKTGRDTINFKKIVNSVLEEESAGYRFVGSQITRITDENEIKAIEEALAAGGRFKHVQTHIENALQKISDRQNPDYRNSIKESISAVEALCKILTEQKKAELSDGLKKVDVGHKALKDAFIKLYGWTSDAEGIRHSLMDESNLDFADAKFMLVSCSAFVNYLITKSADK